MTLFPTLPEPAPVPPWLRWSFADAIDFYLRSTTIMRITLESLRALGACKEGLADFRAAFPCGLTVKPGARLTPRTAERLATLAHHFGWFTGTLPAPAWAEYVRAIATAEAEYHRAVATAWAEYHRAVATRATADGLAIAPALAEYDRARVHALWRALGGGAP